MNPAKKDCFLFLGPESPAKVAWAERPAYGEVVIGQGPLSEALHLRGEKVVVVVPASAVLLTEVVMPGARGGVIKKSIPYALEENLADDIETLHFAHGPLHRSGEIPVAVVARSEMETWLAILDEHGITAKCLVPATLTVPLTAEQWSLVVGDSQFLLRKDSWHAYGGDIGSLAFFLADELASGPEQQAAVQLYTDGECDQNCEEALAGLRIADRHKTSLFKLQAEGYDEKAMINLLQGDYGRHAGWRELWTKWQLPVVAVGLLCLLNLTGFAFEYFRLNAENTELNRQITALYLQSFPGSRKVVNARVQMEQKLTQLQQDLGLQGGFFEIYDKTVTLLLATSGFSLSNLRYSNGLFDFDFAIKDLESLEAFKQELGNIPGVAMDIKHADASGSQVKAKIQIKSRK